MAWTSRSVTTTAFMMFTCFSRLSHEMISDGRKWVQIATSGWYLSRNLMNGTVLSLSNASRTFSFLPGTSRWS